MSSNSSTPSPKPLPLGELVALSEELAAMVRAGTSLEQGLIDLGTGSLGRLGDTATRFSERLQSGESLVRMLGDDSLALPRFWRATILAGIRTGRLASVLESVATAGRRLAEARRNLGAAFIYPLVVMALAYVVFVCLTVFLAPTLLSAFTDLTGSSEPYVRRLTWLGEHVSWWVFWPPAFGLVCLMLDWYSNRRDFLAGGGLLTRSLVRVWPSWRRSRRDAQSAAFAEILSLLIREEMPLPEALRLAAEASSDDRLRASAILLADRVGSGRTLSPEEVGTLDMPPLLGFMLVTGSHRVELADALSRAADNYRERSASLAARNVAFLPVMLSAVVGGFATLALSLIVFRPIAILLLRLASPN